MGCQCDVAMADDGDMSARARGILPTLARGERASRLANRVFVQVEIASVVTSIGGTRSTRLLRLHQRCFEWLQ